MSFWNFANNYPILDSKELKRLRVGANLTVIGQATGQLELVQTGALEAYHRIVQNAWRETPLADDVPVIGTMSEFMHSELRRKAQTYSQLSKEHTLGVVAAYKTMNYATDWVNESMNRTKEAAKSDGRLVLDADFYQRSMRVLSNFENEASSGVLAEVGRRAVDFELDSIGRFANLEVAS